MLRIGVRRMLIGIVVPIMVLLLLVGEPPRAHAQGLPDLIVSNIILSPAHPYVGDVVSLSAVVKNQGTAATPDGVAIGGVFYVDGQFVAYTDNDKQSLPAGGSVTVTANGGGAFGNGTWVAQAGTHVISFLVDDVNRIQESNEDNNTFALPPIDISVENGPDLIVSKITWLPPNLIDPVGKPVIFNATVENRGTQPLPARSIVTANFAVDGKRVGAGISAPTDLPPGHSLTLVGAPAGSAPWSATVGLHVVSATVDPDNHIAETHEDNNVTSMDFAVGQDWSTTPRSSDTFVDSVGVNVHLSYLDTSYGQYDTLVKPMLLQAGIHHVRDGGFDADFLAKVSDLAKSGVKTDFIVGPGNASDELAAIKPQVTQGAIDSLEGPNEPDNFYPAYWPDGIRTFQNSLYDAAKADPTFSSLPLLAPSLGNAPDSWKLLGAVKCDLANVHLYESYPGVRLQEMVDANTHVCPQKKGTWITETGYHTALSQKAGVTETAQGKYVLRAYLLAFSQGIGRTFYYEFLDERPDPNLTDSEQHFGIIRADGTPKPAYTGLKNMLALLGDPGNSFTPAALNYQVSGNVSHLGHLLLQKRDGSYELALWLNVPSMGSDGKDLTVTPQQMTLNFSQRFSQAQAYQPLTSSSGTRLPLMGRSITVNVTDAPLIIELKP